MSVSDNLNPLSGVVTSVGPSMVFVSRSFNTSLCAPPEEALTIPPCCAKELQTFMLDSSAPARTCITRLMS